MDTKKQIVFRALEMLSDSNFSRGKLYKEAQKIDSNILSSTFGFIFNLDVVNGGHIKEVGKGKYGAKIYTK